MNQLKTKKSKKEFFNTNIEGICPVLKRQLEWVNKQPVTRNRKVLMCSELSQMVNLDTLSSIFNLNKNKVFLIIKAERKEYALGQDTYIEIHQSGLNNMHT